MTAIRQPEPTLASGGKAADVNDITGRDARKYRSVDTNDNSNEAEGPLESDMSDLEAPKEFKEGGYGWYVGKSSENMVLELQYTKCLSRIVVLAVFLINMHTWGMNSVS